MNPMTTQRGFTYIELLVTVALLGLLAMMAVPLLSMDSRRTREFTLQADLRELRSALDNYKQAAEAGKVERPAGSSGYPPSLQILADGVKDKSDASGKKMLYFLRRIPRDPMCNCPNEPAAQTWQLRSYDSSSDDPQAGDDVFDVTSRSQEKGLNGVPYNQW